jgi:hypothetical protein
MTMLLSDGLSRSQFLPLWHDSMWHAVDPNERARLVLELGRLNLRDEVEMNPLVVAFSSKREPPFAVMSMNDAPSISAAPGIREGTKERLAELGASEVYVLMTLKSPPKAEGHVAGYVLVAWGETVDGEEVCTMMAYRRLGGELEEAPKMVVPQPADTEVSRQCRGLLTAQH